VGAMRAFLSYMWQTYFEWDLENILICRQHIMNGLVGIKKY
jgi:hypothetical protein